MISCGHCKEKHETVAEVRKCAGKQLDSRPHSLDPYTRQALFAAALQGAPEIVKTVDLPLRDPDWKRRAPDGVIRGASDVTEGMWIIPNDPPEIYKVQRAVHGSGNLYAKRLIVPQYDGDKATFEYVKGGMRILARHARPMTLEEAKEFGALYGTCCVCGRTLTREESIEAGIGPVCAGKAFAS